MGTRLRWMVVMPEPALIVLCGGNSRRLGGVDKTRESLAGTTVMDHLLHHVPPGWVVLCVGEKRPTRRPVEWCRESPVGGGPVAGIHAALQHVGQVGHSNAGICAVVGGDMPFAAAALPTLVDDLTAQPGLDAVLASDPEGRTQPLLAAYRIGALRAAIPRQPGGARLMSVVDALTVGIREFEARITLDVDTPEALEEARHIVGT